MKDAASLSMLVVPFAMVYLKYDVQDWTTFRHSVSGDTPMHVAAREGHLNVVEYLCDAFERPDFKVNVVNKDMKRPLHEAAQFARTHVLRYLIEKGAFQSEPCLNFLLSFLYVGIYLTKLISLTFDGNDRSLFRDIVAIFFSFFFFTFVFFFFY